MREHWALPYFPVFFQGKMTFYSSPWLSVIYAAYLWSSLLGEERGDLKCILLFIKYSSCRDTTTPSVLMEVNTEGQ